jgi:hypothetical protein
MTKLFNKIRKTLIKKGKTANYLKYAIGEILLVVIGILIALQINNWNELRKQRLEELETLKNIKSDFTNAIFEFEENNAFRERIISATKILYGIMHTKQNNYSKKQLDSILSELLINPTYNGQSETLNILFNSGKINIISNDSIKNALVIWPQQVEDMTEDEIYSSNIIYNDLYPILKRYVPLLDITNSIQYKFKLLNYSGQSAFSSDYESLLNDREFESTLATREVVITVSLVQTGQLIATAKNIIELIDNEINALI